MRQTQTGNMLLNTGINVNRQNNNGWTVLHFTAASYPAGPTETLLEKGVSQVIKNQFWQNRE